MPSPPVLQAVTHSSTLGGYIFYEQPLTECKKPYTALELKTQRDRQASSKFTVPQDSFSYQLLLSMLT